MNLFLHAKKWLFDCPGYSRFQSILLSLIIGLVIVLALNSCSQRTMAEQVDTLTLPSIINNHMVLQQQSDVAIWGWDRPGTDVRVEFRGNQRSAQAGLDGKWLVRIPSGTAGGAFPLAIQGTRTISLDDVLVGEVWVAGGQSNMWWAVRVSRDAEQTIAAANNPSLRVWDANTAEDAGGWRADTPQKTVQAEWKTTTPETVGAFPATPYFFARELYQTLQVPIGIVHLAVPGREIEAFLSREFITAHLPQTLELEEQRSPFPRRNEPENPGKASELFNGMVYPTAPYTARGFLWWQGESNANRALQYRVLFPGLIEEWRNLWQQQNAPFLYAELANFLQPQTYPVEDDPWPALRDAQKEALRLPNTAMVSNIDVLMPGEDVTGHPGNKQLSGHRFYLAAMAQAYGNTDLEWSGPVFKSAEFRGREAIATFDHVGEKLMTSDGEALRGFALAGPDQRFFWAEGRIEGNTVRLTSDAVPNPVAIRYNWANNPIGNLYNAAGLPTFPFRSDTWLLRMKKLQLQQMERPALITYIDRQLISQASELRSLWEQAYSQLNQDPKQAASLIGQLLQQPLEDEVQADALAALWEKLQ